METTSWILGDDERESLTETIMQWLVGVDPAEGNSRTFIFDLETEPYTYYVHHYDADGNAYVREIKHEPKYRHEPKYKTTMNQEKQQIVNKNFRYAIGLFKQPYKDHIIQELIISNRIQFNPISGELVAVHYRLLDDFEYFFNNIEGERLDLKLGMVLYENFSDRHKMWYPLELEDWREFYNTLQECYDSNLEDEYYVEKAYSRFIHRNEKDRVYLEDTYLATFDTLMVDIANKLNLMEYVGHIVPSYMSIKPITFDIEHSGYGCKSLYRDKMRGTNKTRIFFRYDSHKTYYVTNVGLRTVLFRLSYPDGMEDEERTAIYEKFNELPVSICSPV